MISGYGSKLHCEFVGSGMSFDFREVLLLKSQFLRSVIEECIEAYWVDMRETALFASGHEPLHCISERDIRPSRPAPRGAL